MRAIFGLGNPGLKYKVTKHNIGFLVCQEFAKRHKIKIKKRQYHALIGAGQLDKHIDVMILLPYVYMNNSGAAVADFLKSNKINLSDLLVVCDDINLPMEAIRIRPKGSAGGHNGLLSIIDTLGSQNFPRLRVGIGDCGVPIEDTKDYVLAPFKKRHAKKIAHSIKTAADACETWLTEGIEAAMNRFNCKSKC